MNLSRKDIPKEVISFFKNEISIGIELSALNEIIESICGISVFFKNNEEQLEFYDLITNTYESEKQDKRREYGDFQTNDILANQTIKLLKTSSSFEEFEFILEPTCGKGSFIIAALKELKGIKKVVGIEIYKPYVFETKIKILDFFLQNSSYPVPTIEIIHSNIFNFNFNSLSAETKSLKTLIIGNPPWITNSELGTISSKNLPRKSNFKKHSGIDAITGKGNFDLGEYITQMVINNFQHHSGYLSFLIKNSVSKNIMFAQQQNKFSISDIKKLNIDAKKEFNVSVGACIFSTKLNSSCEFICDEFDFYTNNKITTFGWINGNFVYSINDYLKANEIEGLSQLEWRQGVKHDCSKIMELEKINGHYINGEKINIDLEPDLMYGLLKSSDLKSMETKKYRKMTIITQKKVGQDTKYIQDHYPKTYKYLESNCESFLKRKSSIYKGKPKYSIFGIGDYSFKPYKVAISGMYKSTHFTLVLPEKDKPIMLDDTCYFISFNKLEFAQITQFLLNKELTQNFLKAIIFKDSKRSITKDILMRIDLLKLIDNIDINDVIKQLDISLETWKEFNEFLSQNLKQEQIELFE